MNIKKITGTVLAAVMLSGSTIAVAKVKAEKAEMAARQDQEWLLQPGQSPTEAESYTLTSNLDSQCPGQGQVCGIIAPATVDNMPDLEKDTGFISRIQSGTEHPDVKVRN